jgi:hypothetical protein
MRIFATVLFSLFLWLRGTIMVVLGPFGALATFSLFGVVLMAWLLPAQKLLSHHWTLLPLTGAVAFISFMIRCGYDGLLLRLNTARRA